MLEVLTFHESPEAPMDEYDGRQFVGIDLHRQSVIVRQSASGEQLSAVGIVNDPDPPDNFVTEHQGFPQAERTPGAVLVVMQIRSADAAMGVAHEDLPGFGCLGGQIVESQIPSAVNHESLHECVPFEEMCLEARPDSLGSVLVFSDDVVCELAYAVEVDLQRINGSHRNERIGSGAHELI